MNLGKNVWIIAVIVLVAIIGAAFMGFRSFSVSTGGIGPGAIMTPWGALSHSDVSGSDLPCIGRYSGMIRGYYTKDTDTDGSYTTTIVYYTKGDKFSDVKSYFTSKILECGYEKTSESQSAASVPGVTVKTEYDADYSKGDDTLSLLIVNFKMSNGDEYTVVQLEFVHNVINEGGSEQNQGSNQQTPSTTPNEVTPTGEAATWNSDLRPIIESVFGKTYLTEANYFTTPYLVYLKYVLSRTTTSSDITSLMTALENNGYQILGSSALEDVTQITMSKGNYLIEMSVETDYIDASIMPKS